MGFPIILYVCILLVRYQSKELFKESQKSLNNYLISKTYLEYATWLLVDIDNLLQYADVTTKIAKFSHIEERFLEIQRLISLAEEINHSNIKANQETINVLIEHSNFFMSTRRKSLKKPLLLTTPMIHLLIRRLSKLLKPLLNFMTPFKRTCQLIIMNILFTRPLNFQSWLILNP